MNNMQNIMVYKKNSGNDWICTGQIIPEAFNFDLGIEEPLLFLSIQ